jgi:hypothetical protein
LSLLGDDNDEEVRPDIRSAAKEVEYAYAAEVTLSIYSLFFFFSLYVDISLSLSLLWRSFG